MSLRNNHNTFAREFYEVYGLEVERDFIKREGNQTFIFYKIPSEWIGQGADNRLVEDGYFKIKYYYGNRFPKDWFDESGFLLPSELRERRDLNDYRGDESADTYMKRLARQRAYQKKYDSDPINKYKRRHRGQVYRTPVQELRLGELLSHDGSGQPLDKDSARELAYLLTLRAPVQEEIISN